VIFPEVRLLGRSIPVIESSILANTIDNQRSLNLTGGRKSFSIYFIAMNYAAPNKTAYRYKLEGFDDEWLTYSGSGLQRATYTNLPVGKYRFVAMASDGSETFGEESTIDIEIVPPFLASNPMLFLYIILTAGCVFMTFKYINRRVKRKHQLQIEAIGRKNRIDILESKVNLFNEVAKEIQIPVSLISSPLEQMAENPEMPRKFDEDINTIRKNCNRLLSLVDRMFDMQDSELAVGIGHGITNKPEYTKDSEKEPAMSVQDKPHKIFMERIDTYIAENMSNSYLSVEDIAEAIGMGRSKFFAQVKTLTGSTPNEYLRHKRLKAATELLSSYDAPRVNEVSYMVGFSSTSYFSKCFVAEFGETPGEFRERHQN
jgi:AraC-like DNA-binding protein